MSSPSDNPAVAVLVLQPRNDCRKKRADHSFEGYANLGIRIIMDVLRRGGIPVGLCDVATAKRHRLVLVPIHSTDKDTWEFYKAVARHPDWQPGVRQFQVLAGGYGVQNPTMIRHWLDWATFGRAHDWILPVVQGILDGKSPSHPSLMHLPELTPVEIHQAPLYEHAVNGDREQSLGCPHKCKFCHYSFARVHIRTKTGAYRTVMNNSIIGGNSVEMTWRDVLTLDKKAGWIRSAVDGFSERLRFLYGKRIRNSDIVAGIERFGSFGGSSIMTLYNISNFPGETQADREELYATFRAAQPKGRVVVALHSTPFRPALCTPMQWEPVSLRPDISKWRYGRIYEADRYRVTHTMSLQTPWSHLLAVVADRARPCDDALVRAIAFARALNRGCDAERLATLERSFDLMPFTRAFDLTEPSPAPFLNGSVRVEILRRIARKMREQAAMGAVPPGPGFCDDLPR